MVSINANINSSICILLNILKFCDQKLLLLFNIINLFAHSLV